MYNLFISILYRIIVTGIVVVSSGDQDPMGQFERIGRAKNMPTMFQNGSYDGNLFRLNILLHDNATDQDMLKKFNCFYL